MLISTIINRMIELRDEVLTLNISDDVRLQILHHLIDDTTQLDTTIRNGVTETLTSILHKPPKPDNAIMKQTGFDTTPPAQREI